MTRQLLLRRNAAVLVAVAVTMALALTALDITPASSQTPWLRALKVEPTAELMDPWADIWNDVRSTEVALSSQAITNPIGGGEVSTVQARALNDGEKLYVMLQWKDGTLDDGVNGQTLFTDAAGLQLPSDPSVRIPSFCMGDPQAGVNIWHWKASWQRDIDSGYASVAELYPGGHADGYLHQNDAAFQPARALGNPVSQTEHVSPVENLIAAGFGTLTTVDRQDVDGRGEWRDGRWRVVFVRTMQQPGGYPSLEQVDITDVAFAVWDGSSGNRDGLKSVSQFMQLHTLNTPLDRDAGGFPWWAWLIPVAVLVTGGLAAATYFVLPARSDRK
jgi:hypothetical protein